MQARRADTTQMPPLYRKIKALQLRQDWQRKPTSVEERFRAAVAGLPTASVQQSPAIEEMIAVILDHEEAEQTNSVVMRAIAA